MSLKITKNRSNLIDILELEETIEEFVENINKGLNSFDSLSTSSNSTKDALYEWDSSYKKFCQVINDSYKIEEYKS